MNADEYAQRGNSPQNKKQNKTNIQDDKKIKTEQALVLVNNELDMELINKKKKDPKEWEKFLKKGRALSELVDVLISIDRK